MFFAFCQLGNQPALPALGMRKQLGGLGHYAVADVFVKHPPAFLADKLLFVSQHIYHLLHFYKSIIHRDDDSRCL